MVVAIGVTDGGIVGKAVGVDVDVPVGVNGVSVPVGDGESRVAIASVGVLVGTDVLVGVHVNVLVGNTVGVFVGANVGGGAACVIVGVTGGTTTTGLYIVR